jgi:UDP-N-acetylmuramoylalanine--D-glutamate ligase
MTQLDLVDPVTRGASFLDALAGRPVTVVGFAREAAAALRRLHAAGAHVRRMEPADPYTALTGEGLVVVTTAAALRAYGVATARAAGVRVLSELDLAWCATEAEAFALAGGPGAATASRVITTLLAAHGRRARPLAEADVDGADAPADVVLVEPTVDQLAAMQVFRPRVAVLLPGAEPLAPRLLAQQGERDCLVLSADDPASHAIARAGRAPVVWLSTTRPVDHGVHVTRGRITARLNGQVEDICSAHGIAAEELEPALAGVSCALWMGLAPETVGAAVRRSLVPDVAPAPAPEGVRVAGGSVRSLLRGRARALFGHPADDASREPASVTTGAR